MTLPTPVVLLLQVLGYAPDFISTAMAPYIKDIHRKGTFLFTFTP